MLGSLLTFDVTTASDTLVTLLRSLGAFSVAGDSCECLYLQVSQR